MKGGCGLELLVHEEIKLNGEEKREKKERKRK